VQEAIGTKQLSTRHAVRGKHWGETSVGKKKQIAVRRPDLGRKGHQHKERDKVFMSSSKDRLVHMSSPAVNGECRELAQLRGTWDWEDRRELKEKVNVKTFSISGQERTRAAVVDTLDVKKKHCTSAQWSPKRDSAHEKEATAACGGARRKDHQDARW